MSTELPFVDALKAHIKFIYWLLDLLYYVWAVLYVCTDPSYCTHLHNEWICEYIKKTNPFCDIFLKFEKILFKMLMIFLKAPVKQLRILLYASFWKSKGTKAFSPWLRAPYEGAWRQSPSILQCSISASCLRMSERNSNWILANCNLFQALNLSSSRPRKIMCFWCYRTIKVSY